MANLAKAGGAKPRVLRQFGEYILWLVILNRSQ